MGNCKVHWKSSELLTTQFQLSGIYKSYFLRDFTLQPYNEVKVVSQRDRKKLSINTRITPMANLCIILRCIKGVVDMHRVNYIDSYVAYLIYPHFSKTLLSPFIFILIKPLYLYFELTFNLMKYQ